MSELIETAPAATPARARRGSFKTSLRRLLARFVASLPRGVLTDEEFFPLYEKRGLHILPVHFYSPVPNVAALDNRLWTKKTALPGIDMRLDEQIARLEAFAAKGFIDEFFSIPATPEDETPFGVYTRARFGGADGAIYWSMIRDRKPKRIVEIGAGWSTLLARTCVDRRGIDCEITAVDPYPLPFLEKAAHELIRDPVENLPLAIFESLEAGDILFIDSSHTVRIGGDTVHEFLEILPRLKPGVAVHIHDIALPREYPKEWVMEHRFWAEQYLLQAFLAFNSAFAVRWGFSFMKEERPDFFARHFPGVDHGSGSFWMERV